MSANTSILELAFRHDLTLDICPYSVEVNRYDMVRSETFTFREHVSTKAERRAALRRCVEQAVAHATKEQQP
jgi:hypothetical protein